MSKKFIKREEDFICDNCGLEVIGNGYTNHCSGCLFSKHVDTYPGDREEVCSGLMKPVSVTKESNGYDIVHKCLSCGIKKRNKSNSRDNFNTIIEIS